jgi:tetratricopeptide (TPR) repeat protein
MAAYESGNYAAAKQAFDQAFGLSPLHSLGLWAARARAKLGELVEADERYDKVLKAPLTERAPSAEREAQQHAASEREELRHRIPHLRIKLEGVDPSEVELRLDGALVADEFVIVQKQSPFPHGKALQLNPGTHQILAVSADQRKDVSVTLAEGQTREVNLRFANSGTLKQRKCRDQCRTDCRDDNDCYVACKQRCFSKAS